MIKKVLIVEDDQSIREIMSIVLEGAGYYVYALGSGRDVIHTVHSFKPDVILMDVMLGDVDGRDICQQLKATQETKHMPVILVSATHDFHTRLEKNCGADDYVSKPFDINDLIHCVQKYTHTLIIAGLTNWAYVIQT